MKALRCLTGRTNQRGAVVIIVAVFLLFAGIGFAAFAIDFAYLHVAKNELQNAADAGALAGARALYYTDGSRVNDDGGDSKWTSSANEVAYDAATANKAQKAAVEVNFDGGGDNDNDVQRGHWSFGYGVLLPRGFTPNPSDVAVAIGNYSEIDLDADPNFINAVRVVTRREASPVKTFFAKIFGQESFTVQAEAIAYRGFTANLPPNEIDLIIALCAQTLWVDSDGDGVMEPDEFIDCDTGRMLNSGPDESRNTGAWTNLTQPCARGNPTTARPLLEDCLESSPGITFEGGIGTTGGTANTILENPVQPNVMDCWVQGSYDDGDEETPLVDVDSDGDGVADYPWTVTVPVIDCPGNNAGADGCPDVLSSVTVNVAWILNQTSPPTGGNACQEAPYRMYNPSTGLMWEFVDEDVNGDGEINACDRWDAFVNAFNLKNVDDIPVTVANDGFVDKSLYFLPSCVPNEPTGTTGGPNFGILAEIPVLVH